MSDQSRFVLHQRGIAEVQRNGDVRPDHDPVHTVRAGGQHHAMVIANREGASGRDAGDGQTPTVTTSPSGGGLAAVLRNNGGPDEGAMLTPGHEPTRALTTKGHQSVVVMPYGSESRLAEVAQAPTITSIDRVGLLVPVGGTWATGATALDAPVPTQTAREARAVVWTDEDVLRCRFRMFETHEIAGAMAMALHHAGGGYVLTGNKREKMAQLGNSVTPPAMAWLVKALVDAGIDASRIIDLFCGAGGSSLGASFAGGQLVMGLNHWPRAVETHGENFPDADHDCEDISSLTTRQIRRYLAHARPTMMIAGPECTNHSIAKGGRRRPPQVASLWEDGPGSDAEQDKSRATMWDVPRFAEQALLLGHPLEAIVVENVTDAFRWGYGDDGGLFQAWLGAVRALGYEHEIVWLNSMFAPAAGGVMAPQSRDRMYVVFWRRGAARPNLKVTPPSWCAHCAQIVAGVQTWKRPAAPCGRFGQQYFYACPTCRGVVIPGAPPAAWIIDETLPATVIGERAKPLEPNTLQRIQRGLTKISNEDPFDFALTKAGAPKKAYTLPLVQLPATGEDERLVVRVEHDGSPRSAAAPAPTSTQRHDLAVVVPFKDGMDARAARDPTSTVTGRGAQAVVLPIAGNTFETTPGNRARRADDRPLDTVHGTLDRALVVPSTASADGRSALTPAPTQTTTTRAAIVTEPA